LFPNYVWNIDTLEKEISLTFDDGPTPEITEWTLNILEQYQAKATFFCIGANVEKHPEIFKKILDAGHSIGNHT
ncbi:polysaccharide deacetylase family protein, partial [Hyunsoonleella flava]